MDLSAADLIHKQLPNNASAGFNTYGILDLFVAIRLRTGFEPAYTAVCFLVTGAEVESAISPI